MKIHYLQHKSYESLGCIAEWIKERGYQVSATKFYQDTNLPKLDEFDFLIIMGGPMGVNDEDKYPWLKDEKKFIAKAIENNKIVLGICLGSQLIAASLGARIYPNMFKEIGWFPIKIKNDNKFFSSFPEVIMSAHWHGDTFDLPPGAILTAESDACKNQAFVYNGKVIGLQFHLEFTYDSLKGLIDNCREELIKDEFVQTEQEILVGLKLLKTTNELMFQLLDKIVGITWL
jgi:GMP synthase-like glutamine amidotransferase